MLPAHFSPCLLANHPLIEYDKSSTASRKPAGAAHAGQSPESFELARSHHSSSL